MPDGAATKQDVAMAYAWLRGNCFRCGAMNVHTAAVGHVIPVGSATVAVRACMDCTIGLEEERAAAAARYGWPYQPGTRSVRQLSCGHVGTRPS